MIWKKKRVKYYYLYLILEHVFYCHNSNLIESKATIDSFAVYSMRHEFFRLLSNSIQCAIISKLIIRTHLFFLSTFIGSVNTSSCAKTPIFHNRSSLAGPGSWVVSVLVILFLLPHTPHKVDFRIQILSLNVTKTCSRTFAQVIRSTRFKFG
jgi:hypothetical protein